VEEENGSDDLQDLAKQMVIPPPPYHPLPSLFFHQVVEDELLVEYLLFTIKKMNRRGIEQCMAQLQLSHPPETIEEVGYNQISYHYYYYYYYYYYYHSLCGYS